MVRKPNYCKGIIIAHGKSELLLAEHITYRNIFIKKWENEHTNRQFNDNIRKQ